VARPAALTKLRIGLDTDRHAYFRACAAGFGSVQSATLHAVAPLGCGSGWQFDSALVIARPFNWISILHVSAEA
jgi:hypothetical protein